MHYYDFDKHWDTFLTVWHSQEVQHQLALEIEEWKPLGFFKDYSLGDPMWSQTKTMYWKLKCLRAAKAQAKQEQHMQKFRNVLSTQYGLFPTRTDFEQICLKQLIKDHQPAANSIHSFIFPEATFMLRKTMLKCAQCIFQHKYIDVISVGAKFKILIPDENIVFDLFGYYFLKYDQDFMYQLNDSHFTATPVAL